MLLFVRQEQSQKIKYYISVVDSTKDKAAEKLEKIAKEFETYVDNI